METKQHATDTGVKTEIDTLPVLQTPFVTQFRTRNFAPFYVVIIDTDGKKVTKSAMMAQKYPSFLGARYKEIPVADRQTLLKYFCLPTTRIIPKNEHFESPACLLTANFGPPGVGMLHCVQKSRYKIDNKEYTEKTKGNGFCHLYLTDAGQQKGLAIIDPLNKSTPVVDFCHYLKNPDKIKSDFGLAYSASFRTAFRGSKETKEFVKITTDALALIDKYDLHQDFLRDSELDKDQQRFALPMKRLTFSWQARTMAEMQQGCGVWTDDSAKKCTCPKKFSKYESERQEILRKQRTTAVVSFVDPVHEDDQVLEDSTDDSSQDQDETLEVGQYMQDMKSTIDTMDHRMSLFEATLSGFMNKMDTAISKIGKKSTVSKKRPWGIFGSRQDMIRNEFLSGKRAKRAKLY